MKDDLRILQNRYPKHPLEYSHSWLSNYRLPTDCNEIYFRSQGDKPKKRKLWFEDLGQQQIRKSRILQWLMATRLKSSSYNSNQITFRYWEQKLGFKDWGGGQINTGVVLLTLHHETFRYWHRSDDHLLMEKMNWFCEN